MNDFELMILVLRKNSRILREYIEQKEISTSHIVQIKYLLSHMNSQLYCVIKALANELERFDIKEMHIESINGEFMYAYRNSNNDLIYYSNAHYWKMDDPDYIPLTVLDHEKGIRFVSDDTLTATSHGTVIFTGSDNNIFYGIVKVLIGFKKRERKLMREVEERKRLEEELKKKNDILANYT